VKIPVGSESLYVAFQVLRRLGDYAEAHGLGVVLPAECGLQIWPEHPRRYRKPDGSFISAGRLPGDRVPRVHVRVPPELVIESVSPHDTGEAIEAKVLAYLSAGVRVVWVLYPIARAVHIYRHDGTTTALGADDLLDGEDIVPGFEVRLSDVFQPAAD
jgi:Uma2 family endonuclease